MNRIASDLQKPCGLVVIRPGEEATFLAPLPIGSLRGVGAATEKRLRGPGIRTIGDLAHLPLELLVHQFDTPGHTLWQLANGIDESLVVPQQQAKSLGCEVTFGSDTEDRQVLIATLQTLAADVAENLLYHGLLACGITLKVRYADFTTVTRSHRISDPTNHADAIAAAAIRQFHRLNPATPLRLLGITATPLLPMSDRQLSLFPQDHNGDAHTDG